METEETIETTEEEVPEETKPLEDSEDKESSSKTFSDNEKRLYARMKKAEAEAKTLKDSLKEDKEETPTNKSVGDDVFDLAKTVASLKEYSPEELDFIQMMSKSKGISPEEAAKTEEANIYIAARRAKVEEENSKLEPSTKQSPTEKSVSDVTSKDLKNMTVSEKEEFLEKLGWGNKSFKRDD